ncbi:M56 family metallopeptidase [Mucilaginibacter pallidiroseus]|uniref:M56 family metallopeptidase n=1 Tax=Mucilaginibacter pallidiroseus TaxID=2599295 RepID=A0A563UJX0_9SPHI|nr:M56 family metallopeptidase [Mucilaginibacter pallidiroseus]TWR31633.1 M56 family metallopeptidase [Mucilaginibacter pallidiroseus]
MPTLFVFLLKINVALLLFCAGYYLVLRQLTFYSLNRVYLITAILFASIYPEIDLSGFAQRHETLTRPVQEVVLIWQTPAQKLITEASYWKWAEAIFWLGAAILAIRFIMQLFSLYMLYRNSRPAKLHNHDVRLMDGNAAPFSFWQSIYVNPANYTTDDLKAILLHEQIHVKGWHTLDILLAELSSIFYWFNPGIWLIKKAVRENIEFITDRKILNEGFDSKTYQYSLVNVSFNNATPGIVNHFNISTIKKRIIMMNAKRSSRANLTRYAFVIPAVVLLLLVFTFSKAEVAKPFTIKFNKAITPVAAAITEASKTAIAFVTDTAPAKLKKQITLVPKKKDTITTRQTLSFTYNTNDAIKLDTGKKKKFYLKIDGRNAIDSMNIVLNGKQIDNAAFSKIDPSTISSINVVKTESLKANPETAAYQNGNDKDYIFIATKDSEDGKALSDRIGSTGITRLRISGMNKDADKAKTTALLNSLPPVHGTVSDLQIVKNDPSVKTVVVRAKGIKKMADTVYIANFKSKADDVKIDNKTLDIRTTGTGVVDDVIVKGYKTTSPATIAFGTDPKSTATYDGKPVRIALTSVNYSGDVNKISDKLILIDGKEATEKDMKKLSAFDIDRVKVGGGTDTLKKYGNKAKNGVVYIYTKKGQ